MFGLFTSFGLGIALAGPIMSELCRLLGICK
jgi:hypothetical protein